MRRMGWRGWIALDPAVRELVLDRLVNDRTPGAVDLPAMRLAAKDATGSEPSEDVSDVGMAGAADQSDEEQAVE